jgi:hypothetical protein
MSGVLGEIGRGLAGALLAHSRQAFGVMGQGGVAVGDQGQGLSANAWHRRIADQAMGKIPRRSSAGEPLDQTGLGQQLEVARHAGLALAQHAAKLQHRQFLAGQQ